MDPKTGLGTTEGMVKGMMGVGGISALADTGMGTQCCDEDGTMSNKDGSESY